LALDVNVYVIKELVVLAFVAMAYIQEITEVTFCCSVHGFKPKMLMLSSPCIPCSLRRWGKCHR